MSVQHLRPEGLNKNPAFTNVIVVTGSAKTVYGGGQDAIDAAGNVVGKGDIRAQTEQAHPDFLCEIDAVAVVPE